MARPEGPSPVEAFFPAEDDLDDRERRLAMMKADPPRERPPQPRGPSIREAVLTALRAAEGLTAAEIAAPLGVSTSRVGATLRSLARSGLVEMPSGERSWGP